MGPLAGIGDSIFWGSLKVIAAGMGIYFAQQGSLLGPILALLVYNLPHLLCRWYGLKLGYRAGTTWLMRIYQSGLMDRVTISHQLWPHGRRRDDRQHDRYHHPAQLYRRADHHEGAGVY
jgi:PTS system mannose-specific IID component/fructoselysine and glucoselysine-specific PTS system IID component